MSIFDVIAENRIQEAMKRGAFDRLPFRGVALDVEEDFSLSAETRFVLKRMLWQSAAKREASPLVARWRARTYLQFTKPGKVHISTAHQNSNPLSAQG